MKCSALAAATGCILIAGCSAPGPREGYYLTPLETLDVVGTYPLSNGDTLRITREHSRYWAQTGRIGKVEIVPVDSLVFAEKAGMLRYTFTPLPFTTEVRIDGLAPPNAYSALLKGAGP
ncbi:hypothetical protein NX773_05020 [Massilia solisilvae]|uniref:Uncharacterized protein n=1 Tax=Massilia solisilvae TaxID=1811225 RepID=A0ABT2BG87_9BURK|nr:hypothetical protein [Massilia solisilvae]MCS0607529.1 hypothetical protein [Massilia solisilvae]